MAQCGLSVQVLSAFGPNRGPEISFPGQAQPGPISEYKALAWALETPLVLDAPSFLPAAS